MRENPFPGQRKTPEEINPTATFTSKLSPQELGGNTCNSSSPSPTVLCYSVLKTLTHLSMECAILIIAVFTSRNCGFHSSQFTVQILSGF